MLVLSRKSGEQIVLPRMRSDVDRPRRLGEPCPDRNRRPGRHRHTSPRNLGQDRLLAPQARDGALLATMRIASGLAEAALPDLRDRLPDSPDRRPLSPIPRKQASRSDHQPPAISTGRTNRTCQRITPAQPFVFALAAICDS